MQARILDIPAAQEATWGAVLSVLRHEHRDDWRVHWRPVPKVEGSSFVEIEAPGEDVDGMRAEITQAVDLVNDMARRDPLHVMVPADIGLVEVLVD